MPERIKEAHTTMKTPTSPKNLAISIVDVIEEMLEEKNITIPDECRTGAPGECRLYGVTYGDLVEQIADLLARELN